MFYKEKLTFVINDTLCLLKTNPNLYEGRVYDISDRRQANILCKIAVKAIIDRGLFLAMKLPRQVLIVVTLKSSLRKIYGCHHYFVNSYKISFPCSCLITGLITRVTRRVSLMKREVLSLQENSSSSPEFCWVYFAQSFVSCICFVDNCLFFF
jgi:hypothetical protein